jgi:hypothetical protein
MASARELLEQADALMRRNRGGSIVEPAAEIPLLTDVVADEGGADEGDFPVLMDAIEGDHPHFQASLQADARPWLAEPRSLLQHDEPASERQHGSAQYGEIARDGPEHESHAQHGRVAGPEWASSSTSDDAPMFPDSLATGAATGEGERAQSSDDPALLRGPDTVDGSLYSATVSSASTISSPNSMSLRAAGSQSTPPPRGSEAPWLQGIAPIDRDTDGIGDGGRDVQDDSIAPADHPLQFSATQEEASVTPPADPALDDELHWRAISEQISMQVLQRIDLFTDSGLKVQLAAHLKPIVDRAGAELVASINDQVGKLLRTYVAEAIEREIAQWRNDNR